MEEAREEAEKEERARKRRVGHLRLRVWDEGTGRYALVHFAANGHDDNPDGGTTSFGYASGASGWGPEHAFEPGRSDLYVYEYPCKGEELMPDQEYVENQMPRITVTIESGKRVDQDIRLDLCSIEPYGLDDVPGPGRGRRDIPAPDDPQTLLTSDRTLSSPAPSPGSGTDVAA